MSYKCSICGSLNVASVDCSKEQYNAYTITKVDTKSTPPHFDPTSGVPVDIRLCQDCGHIDLFLHKD